MHNLRGTHTSCNNVRENVHHANKVIVTRVHNVYLHNNNNILIIQNRTYVRAVHHRR